MRVFEPKTEFANRFLRNRSFYTRVFEIAGTVFLGMGSYLAIVTYWSDPSSVASAALLLLAGIGWFSFLSYSSNMGIMADLESLVDKIAQKDEESNSR